MAEPLSDEVLRETIRILMDNNNNKVQAAKEIGITRSSLQGRVRKAKSLGLFSEADGTIINREDKNVAVVNWRDISEYAKAGQEIEKQIGNKQTSGIITLKTDQKAILLLGLGDIHIGSKGTCYDILEQITDLIISKPYIFLGLHGDLIDNFLNFFSKAAMFAQCLSPNQQRAFLDSWIMEIWHKILYAGWGNHEEFEEKLTSLNSTHDLLAKRITFFDGLAKVTLNVNDVQYTIVVTHRTPGNSVFNKTHGMKRVAREHIPEGDIYFTADKHTPAYEVTWEREKEQCFMMTGTFKKKDVYAQRYFTYLTHVEFPCLVLNTREKEFSAFSTIEKAMHYCEKMNYE